MCDALQWTRRPGFQRLHARRHVLSPAYLEAADVWSVDKVDRVVHQIQSSARVKVAAALPGDVARGRCCPSRGCESLSVHVQNTFVKSPIKPLQIRLSR